MLKLKNAPGLNYKLMTAGLMLTIDESEVATTVDDVAAQAVIDAWTLAEAAAYVCIDVVAYAKDLRNKVIGTRSPGELASWSDKRSEAAEYAASGDETRAPGLKMEAKERGCLLWELCARVNRNAQLFVALEAKISGTAGRHCDAIKACQSFDEIAVYDWSTGWPQV